MNRKESSDHPVIEAMLEGTETVAHVLVHSEVLAGIPVVGTALRALKARDAFRDAALIAKLAKFIDGAASLTEADAEKMRAALADPEEARRVGETLFLTIDKLTETDKATLLGELFTDLVHQRLPPQDFRRLVRAIDVAFFDDLVEFLATDMGRFTVPVRMRLVDAGLIVTGSYAVYGGAGMTFAISPLGELFHRLYTERRAAEASGAGKDSKR